MGVFLLELLFVYASQTFHFNTVLKTPRRSLYWMSKFKLFPDTRSVFKQIFICLGFISFSFVSLPEIFFRFPHFFHEVVERRRGNFFAKLPAFKQINSAKVLLLPSSFYLSNAWKTRRNISSPDNVLDMPSDRLNCSRESTRKQL